MMKADDVKKIKVESRGYYSINSSEARATLIPEGTVLLVESWKDNDGDIDYYCNYNGINVIIEDVNAIIIG